MNAQPSDAVREVFLNPGDYHFGEAGTRIATLLGSCVSITLWHPRWRVGGMCHYILPTRGGLPPGACHDGRYGDEALLLLIQAIWQRGLEPREFLAKLFGGANMFTPQCHDPALNVGTRNIDMGLALLTRYAITLQARHIGGDGHRRLILDIASGDVWLRHQPIAAPSPELAA